MARKRFQSRRGGDRRPVRKGRKSRNIGVGLGLSPRHALARGARYSFAGPGDPCMQNPSASVLKQSGGADLTTQQNVGLQSFLTHTGNSGDAIVATPTAVLDFAFAFSLGDLPQVASWSALFDQYRIEKIKLRFMYRGSSISILSAASPNALLPMAHVVLDFDDSNALTTIASALEYATHRYLRPGDSLEIEFTPAIARALYASGAFTGYELIPSNQVWIDMANTGVPHYGVKGVIENLTTASTENVVWDVNATYVVSFSNVR